MVRYTGVKARLSWCQPAPKALELAYPFDERASCMLHTNRPAYQQNVVLGKIGSPFSISGIAISMAIGMITESGSTHCVCNQGNVINSLIFQETTCSSLVVSGSRIILIEPVA